MTLIHKILIPTDFSPDAERALDYALELARAFSAGLVLLHVYAVPVAYSPEGFAAPLIDTTSIRDAIDAGLDKFAKRARDHGIRDIEIEVADGVAWREIVTAAKERGCDLVVMGTHGRGGFSRVVMGSTAERVVRKAECPVLTVGPKAHIEEPN